MSDSMDRRNFLKRSAAAGAGLSIAGGLSPVRGAKEAPSDQIRVSVMGVNSRGDALARGFARISGSEVAYVCDVDSRAVERTIGNVNELQETTPEGAEDFRRTLEDNDVDALAIAAPDHWHTPAALQALQAGKHVYIEKPCGHNPREGEMLIEAQQKYNRVIQMGNQRRSWPNVQEAIQRIHSGVVGRAYYARAWYANTRPSIGFGKPAEVPSWLNYELWQGPAPRTQYLDNRIHYNWHWFWRWGTAETCNNGTHEIDVCRWALDVDYPTRVVTSGGHYHWNDDRETPDTQVVSYDFENDRTITWEGRSCNGRPIEGHSRGASIHGEKGTVIIYGNNYVVYDNDNNELERVESDADSGSNINTTGPGNYLDDVHFNDFLTAIRESKRPNSYIEGGHRSVLLCHLGNIAYKTGDTLFCDPSNGHIVGNREAMNMWDRDYEPGWEPTV